MTPAAQRTPSPREPARIARHKRLLRLLQAISPRLAARLAFTIFLTPMRREMHPADAPFMAGAKQHLLHAAGDRVQVYEWGAGARTALIAHGWGSRASRFAPLASALVARGWRVLAFDAPAHGRSPGRLSSLPQFVAAMDAVATQLGPVQALVGHSVGALAIACRRTGESPAWLASVQRLVLISMPAGAPFLVDAFRSRFDAGAATSRHMQRRFLARFGAEPAAFTVVTDSAAMRLPTLLVHDHGDDIVPFAHSEQLLACLPRGRLLATRDQGHSALNRDATTIRSICDFLDERVVPSPVQVRRADLDHAADAATVVRLLNAYACDPRGGGEPLPATVQARLVAGLRAIPAARVWLAFDGSEPVGVCVAFFGYSTFRALPLLNIHDLAVLPEHRGRGAGRALLAAAETEASATGCCRLTLEVQDDNAPARRLYERSGFRDVRHGDSGPARFLGKSLPPPAS